jgi:CubicO group peptidase (beta-lactamase class C family)
MIAGRLALAGIAAWQLLSALPVHTQTPGGDLYFPAPGAAWESVAPASVRWDAAALTRALAFAGEHRSTGMVILHRGRILAEQYWKVDDAPRGAADASGRPVEDVASVQKSVLSTLIGIAVERKLLDLDAPVSTSLGPGWSKASPGQEQAITVRHLMSMTSGLGEGMTYEHPPGQRWFYNTPAYSRLIDVVARVSGRDPNAYTSEWLTKTIGATDTRWIPRPPGGPNPYGLQTTASDLARFGLLILADGRWRGVPLVPGGYLREAFRPSQALNPSYGLLWWINAGDGWEDWTQRGRQGGRFIPTAPPDLVAARGAGDRRLYIVPSLGLVVTRLGAPTQRAGAAVDTQFFDRELWRRLMEAAPPTSSEIFRERVVR